MARADDTSKSDEKRDRFIQRSIGLKQRTWETVEHLVDRFNAVVPGDTMDRTKMVRWLIQAGTDAVDQKIKAMEDLET